MGKGTKVAIKVKGTAKGVKKALATIVNMPAPVVQTPLREADARRNLKKSQ